MIRKLNIWWNCQLEYVEKYDENNTVIHDLNEMQTNIDRETHDNVIDNSV